MADKNASNKTLKALGRMVEVYSDKASGGKVASMNRPPVE
jgi:hypothetical protein